jgi:ABC-type transport system involved in cytochrome bd biosynthesis fused ATPase/permease subunit
MRFADLRLLLTRSSSRRLFFVSVFGAALSIFLVITHALVIARIVVGLVDSKPGVLRDIYFLAAIWATRTLFTSTFEFWCSRQAVRIKREIRQSITSQIDLIPGQSPGSLSQTLIKALNALDIYYGRFIPQVISASATPFVIIAVIWFFDHLSAYIALATIPLIPLFGALIGKYTSDAVAAKWQTLGTLSGYFEDSLRGFVTLRLFGRTRTQHDRIKEMGDRYTAETMKVLRISFLSSFALELAATLSVALIAVTIGVRLVDSGISFLSALTVLLLAPEVYFPLRNAAALFHASADGADALEAISRMKNSIEPQVKNSDKNFSAIEGISWSASTLEISSTKSAQIEQGSLLAGGILFIQGASGSGKTTFALSLLAQRFEIPIVVLTDLHAYTLERGDQKDWLKEIGWVSQNPQFAPGTIKEQFRNLNQEMSESEIVIALESCGLAISDLNRGLETVIGGFGEKADQVSGGQLRKIALARALATYPQLLIADEPTADCDDLSAQIVMERLRIASREGALVIVISHDASIRRDGDKTVLVKEVMSVEHA